MLLSSTLGKTGDNAKLVSPVVNFPSPVRISFWLFLQPLIADEVAKFEIFDNWGMYMKSKVFSTYGEDRSKTRDWTHHSVLLPSGTYSLTMLGTIGKPLASDIAVASVTIEYTPKVISNGSLTDSPGEFSCLKYIYIYIYIYILTDVAVVGVFLYFITHIVGNKI